MVTMEIATIIASPILPTLTPAPRFSSGIIIKKPIQIDAKFNIASKSAPNTLMISLLVCPILSSFLKRLKH
jgi:hypothetical protein